MKVESFGPLNGAALFKTFPFWMVVYFSFWGHNGASAAQLVFVLDGDHAMLVPFKRFGMTVGRFPFLFSYHCLGVAHGLG